MKFSILFVLMAGAAVAQPLGFGVKIGAPLNDAFDIANGSASFTDKAKKFTIGPMVELRLPFGLGIEADALYRRLSYGATATVNDNGLIVSQKANSWEIPILAKYRFGFPIVKPYVEAGPTWRYVTNVSNSVSCLSSSACDAITFKPEKNGAGFTMGAGVEVRAILIRISPELRYTRWGSSALGAASGALGSLIHVNQNQAEFLVGISF